MNVKKRQGKDEHRRDIDVKSDKQMNVCFPESQCVLLVNYCLSDSPPKIACIHLAIVFVMGLIAFAVSAKKPNMSGRVVCMLCIFPVMFLFRSFSVPSVSRFAMCVMVTPPTNFRKRWDNGRFFVGHKTANCYLMTLSDFSTHSQVSCIFQYRLCLQSTYGIFRGSS